MKATAKVLLGSLVFAVISACGGGGDSSPAPPSGAAAPAIVTAPPNNAIPVANAGPDQTAFVDSIVTLDGGASSDANGDILSYKWIFLSAPPGSRAALVGATSVRPTFTPDLVGIYTASLIVNDGKANSVADTIIITVSPKLQITNSQPTANAGPNQVVPVGSIVLLTGAGSSDPNGDTLAFTWTMVSKPAGSSAALVDVNTSRPTFFADRPGTYSVILMVNDGKGGHSSPSTVLVTAVSAPTNTNVAPIAHAGVDQAVVVGTIVNLDGSASSDPNGDPLTYAWTLKSKPIYSTAQLTSSTSARPQFTADLEGVYEIGLSVNDGKLNSISQDSITVVARRAGFTVIPDTGIYRCTTLTREAAAALYAAGHTYLDRDHDGKPCEANDVLNENATPSTPSTPSTGGQCYVRGYYRSNGTYVSGYYRRCPG